MIRILPSELATGARDVFADLVRRHAAAGPTSDGYFARDHRPLWREVVAGGWHCVGLPEERGGSGFDLLDLTAFAEVWGGSLIPLPYMPTVLLLRWAGVSADGAPASMLTYGVGRDACDPADLGIAPFAGVPGTVSVGRLTSGSFEPAAHSTARFAESSELDPAGTLSMPLERVPFVTEGLPGQALQEIAVLGAAELVGVAATMLDKSVSYARQREQFGRPIREYQAVQHRLADMLCDLEVARSAVVKAVNEPTEWRGAVAVAWERALRVEDNCIRVHGGFGMTWDAGLHQFTRHIMAWGELLEACGVGLRHL